MATLLPFQERWIKENPLFSSRWFWHVLFWTTRALLYGTLWGIEGVFEESSTIFPAIRRQLFYLPAEMLLVYSTLYFLIPRFLLNRKYTTFFGLLIGFILTAGLLKRLTMYYLYYPNFDPSRVLNDYFAFYKIIQTAVLLNLMVVSAAVAIKLVKLWYRNQMTMRELIQEKLEAELNFLKAQIHPHFLFNTLNSIYGLALKRSEHTANVVLKLSGLLNYILYDCSAPQVSLKKEIEYVEDYIALEQVRYGERLDVSFSVSGELYNKVIAPLLILTFVENSFKHGVSTQTEQAWIKIDLNLISNQLNLVVENSKPKRQHGSRNGGQNGIGLTNVKRRLDLIYPHNYNLDIREMDDAFEVSLKLILEPELLRSDLTLATKPHKAL